MIKKRTHRPPCVSYTCHQPSAYYTNLVSEAPLQGLEQAEEFEDRLGTGPPRARTEVIYINIRITEVLRS